MKKLFLLIVLFPLFGFSQVLIEDVSRMSFNHPSKNIHKTTEVNSNMTVFVEKGFLCVKSNIESYKFKIIKKHLAEDVNGEKDLYEIVIDNEKYYASIVYYKKSKVLLLKSIKDDDFTLYYENQGY